MSGVIVALAVILAVTTLSSEAVPQIPGFLPPQRAFQQEFRPPSRRPIPSSPLPLADDTRGITFETLISSLFMNSFNIIDVRTRDELEQSGMIPGSHNLPLQEIEEALALSEEAFQARYGFPKLKVDDDTMVLTCRSGARAQVADQILRARGFTRQRIYYGSFLDWVARGGPVVKPVAIN